MNVLVFPQLIELFPKARLIFVVRDPRAIVSSLLEVGARARAKRLEPPFFTKNLLSAILYTRECLEKGFQAAKAVPERVYIVVYEKLVRAPLEETKAICDFLQIAWEPSMLQPARKQHAGEGAITVFSDEIWYDAKAYYKDPDADRVDRWRHQLSSTDQVTIAHWFRYSQELCALGYDLNVAHYAPMTRLFGVGKSQFLRCQRGLSSRLWQYLSRLQPPSP